MFVGFAGKNGSFFLNKESIIGADASTTVNGDTLMLSIYTKEGFVIDKYFDKEEFRRFVMSLKDVVGKYVVEDLLEVYIKSEKGG